jgi:transcriptional regulator with GAF, ATPase, and Fis domain
MTRRSETETEPDAVDGILERFDALLEQAARIQDPALWQRLQAAWDRQRRSLSPRPSSADQEFPSSYGIIGQSPAMQKVFDLLAKVVQCDYPVLIQGESGTGKELVAQAVHQYGARAKKPFLSENCAAIPETLLESILFGHVRGAFTGAHRDNPGHFVACDGGTLFLDEIGDMSQAMQTKLLRVIEDGEVRPVGGRTIRKVDVRLVAASNKNLQAMAERREFREDLYFRLNVLTLQLPPLRDRGDDVWLIARFLVDRAARESGRSLRLADGVRPALQACEWRGNVRQLENEVRRAIALGGGELIQLRDFSEDVAKSR